MAKHGTDNPVEALAKEAELGRFESVLRLFGELPPDVAGENNAQLLRLRALYALGRRTEADDATKNKIIDDGEYYLIKAKLSYDAGSAVEAFKTLEKSLRFRAQILGAETIHREYLFYRALCLGRMFDQAPSEDNRKTALDAWFEVKNYLRKIPDHVYFKKAVVEMQRIGDANTHGKG
jgi:tetratricopeptide (TPR) repeat protein